MSSACADTYREGEELVYTTGGGWGGGWVLASVNSKDGLETGGKSQAETAVHTQNAFFLQKPWVGSESFATCGMGPAQITFFT